MEITTEQRNTCTILVLNGRLDTDGAAVLVSCVDRLAAGGKTALVLDLSAVPYLSSGGIRGLNLAYRAVKKADGIILLAGATEFLRKVLDISGFSRVFPQYGTVDEAVSALGRRYCRGNAPGDWTVCPAPGHPVTVKYCRITEGSPVLVSAGPWKDMHLSGLKEEDLGPVRSGEDYSIGIGAFGPTPGESIGALGDMIGCGPVVAWAPPGSGAADYVLRDSGTQAGEGNRPAGVEIPGVFSACSLTLDGETTGLMAVEAGTGPGKEFTLGELCALLCARAGEEDPGFSGVLAVKMLVRTDRAEALVRTRAPIDANRPDDRETIGTGANFGEWYRKDIPEPGKDRTLAIFGIVCDRSRSTGISRQVTDVLFPGGDEPGDCGVLMYVLGISVRPAGWNPGAGIDEEIRRVVTGGEVLGVHRLTGGTIVRGALAGVSPVGSFRGDDGPVIEFATPCPEWTGRHGTIARELHRGSRSVTLSRISGGFSGSLVFRAGATDRSGRRQMPFVMKIGPWAQISDEIRGYTEYVERYILNSSTKLIQHCRAGDLGGILYNFVGIGASGSLVPLEDLYRTGPGEQTDAAFDRLFRVVLASWYGQPARSEYALYREYGTPRLYGRSREYAIGRFGVSPADLEIDLPCNLGRSANPLWFIEQVVPARSSSVSPVYLAVQHGDLNLKNVLLDQEGQMWLIDFSDTRVTHNLRDIAKLETVIRTELVTLASDEDVCGMAALDEPFLSFQKIGEIPVMPAGDIPGDREKAFRVIRRLRYYADLVTILDDAPAQYLLALLWYTLPVLWYGSVGEFGKKYAWITASRICERLKDMPG